MPIPAAVMKNSGSLTPSTIRVDAKCGKSGISGNKRCRKGNSGSTVNSPYYNNSDKAVLRSVFAQAKGRHLKEGVARFNTIKKPTQGEVETNQIRKRELFNRRALTVGAIAGGVGLTALHLSGR
jgi:hypothetical protein